MKLRFLGQSGYELTGGGAHIIIDPYLSDSVNRVAGRARTLPVPVDPAAIVCDAVICTHNHLDHLDPDTVSAIPASQFYITTAEGKEVLADLGRENVTALSHGQSVRIGELELISVFADHTVEAMGVVVKGEGVTLYFSGDTLYNEELFSIRDYAPDITFICINGRLGNMNVGEALTVARRIGAKVNVPNHYDMFASNSEDPLLFSEHIEGGKVLEFDKEYDVNELLGE